MAPTKRLAKSHNRPSAYPWLVLAVVLAGTYLALLNTTVLGVALADIAADFQSGSALDVDWVVTVYLLAVVTAQPLTAWATARVGHRRVYLSSMAGFALGAALCSVAPTLPLLLLARFVQGIGGGALMPLGMAMVLAVFPPHRRGLVLGLYGTGVMGAPAFGPPVGGFIVTQWSWRWLFVILVALAAVAVVAAVSVLRDAGRGEPRRLDTVGWLLVVAGISLVVIGARQAGTWGYGSPAALGLIAAGCAVLAVFVWHSSHRDQPVLELRLLAVPVFGVSMLMVWTTSVVQLARLNFLPIELRLLHGLSAQEVGLLLAPAAIGMAASMPAGGWLTDRIGARIPVATGLAFLAVTTWQLATLTPETSLRQLVAVLTAQGVGIGLLQVPYNVAAMNALPNSQVTHAATLRTLNRQVASALGTAVLAAIVVARIGALAPDPITPDDLAQVQQAYNMVFWVALALVAASFPGALLMPGRRRMKELQASRAVEFEADA